MPQLPEQFKERMRAQLGASYPDFIACFDEPPKRGLRVNTLKIGIDEFVAHSPYSLQKTGIIDEGFVIQGAENVGKHPYHAAGLFYMQEPSAMSSTAFCGADDSGLRVLDMCAAPGGKAGGAAARMRGRGVIIANEIVPKRARLLAQNTERLGLPNAAVICERPDRIAAALPGFFDTVLVDAPCSGEGMFRKDETAILEWSPEHVAACAERQKLIMESAADCVAPGGAIVYSTCTFSPDENEGVIEAFISKHADFSVEIMERLYPHSSCGEGHFVCRLRRAGERSPAPSARRIPELRDKAALAAVGGFAEDLLENGLPEGALVSAGERIKLIPRDMPAEVLSLRPVACGVDMGEMRKGRFEPSHTFFMAALGAEFTRRIEFEPEDERLFAFLAGNTVPCPENMRGWAAVCIKAGEGAYPIGFGKAVAGTMKNHLPKGLYINR